MKKVYCYSKQIKALKTKIAFLERELKERKRRDCEKLLGKMVKVSVRSPITYYDNELIVGRIMSVDSEMITIFVDEKKSFSYFKIFGGKDFGVSLDEIQKIELK